MKITNTKKYIQQPFVYILFFDLPPLVSRLKKHSLLEKEIKNQIMNYIPLDNHLTPFVGLDL